MNASYNDQLKQSNRAFSTCWDSDALSNTWAYSKTGFKSSGRRHVLFQRFLKKSFAVLKQPIFLVNSTFTNPDHGASTKSTGILSINTLSVFLTSPITFVLTEHFLLVKKTSYSQSGKLNRL